MIFNELNNVIVEEDKRTEEVVVETPEFSLPIEDDLLNHFINERIGDSKKFLSSKKIEERQKRNVRYYLGEQVEKENLDTWQDPHTDNILRRDLEIRVTLAASRMPDIVVSPANDTIEDRERAKKFEDFLSKRLNSSDVFRIVKDGLRTRELKFTGAIKVRWDKNKGENGDFVFELIKPENLIFDTSSPIPHDGFTADNMDFIAHWIEEPVSVVMSKFPQKKEVIREMTKCGTDPKRLAGKMRYLEVYFTYHDTEGRPIEGIAWRFKNEILGKDRTPVYDYEGYEDVIQDEFGNFDIGKKYRNHFDMPRKPFVFFTLENLGDSGYDDTTAFEQSIANQNILNKRLRQITEIADNTVPRLIFAGRYITKEQAQRVTNDPFEHIWLEDAERASDAFGTVQAAPPHPILLQDANTHRAQIDANFSTQATTRGENVTSESGVSKQITREGDLTTSDDISKVIVERVTFELANWATQMMKLFYNKEHYIKQMGEDGEMTFLDMSQDQIDDGINVIVKSNSVDKQTRRALAMELAGTQGIDPLSLLTDLGVPNPKERVQRLLAFQMGSQDGFARYQSIIGVDANTPGGQNETVQGGSEPMVEVAAATEDPMGQSMLQQALSARIE